jgi:hypothetical protein
MSQQALDALTRLVLELKLTVVGLNLFCARGIVTDILGSRLEMMMSEREQH